MYICQYAYLLYCTIVVILTTQNVTDLCSFLFYKVWFIKEQCTFCYYIKTCFAQASYGLRFTQLFNVDVTNLFLATRLCAM